MKLYHRAEELMSIANGVDALKNALSYIEEATSESMNDNAEEQDAMSYLYKALGLMDASITAVLRARAKALTAKPDTKDRHFKFVGGDMVPITDEEWEADFREREENATRMNPEYGESTIDDNED